MRKFLAVSEACGSALEPEAWFLLFFPQAGVILAAGSPPPRSSTSRGGGAANKADESSLSALPGAEPGSEYDQILPGFSRGLLAYQLNFKRGKLNGGGRGGSGRHSGQRGEAPPSSK